MILILQQPQVLPMIITILLTLDLINYGRQGRMLNRMSDLVHRIRSRSQSSTSSGSKIKKRKMERVKEHRIQVCWSQWSKAKCEFMPVKQKNGGGDRYIVYIYRPPKPFAR